MDIPNLNVFDWLQSEETELPSYLVFLNLRWSKEGEETDISQLKCVAKKLALEPEYWEELILTKSWRHTLIGVCCLLISKNKNFCRHLIASIKQGNMVVPQITVALCLLCPDQAISFLEDELLDSEQPDERLLGAAKSFFKLKGSDTKINFVELESKIPEYLEGDFEIGERAFEEHWNYWSKYVL